MLETLYSKEQTLKLQNELSAKIKNYDDSAYIVVEEPNFENAVLVAGYVSTNGKWLVTLQHRQVSPNAEAQCQKDSISKMTIDERADLCYYNDQNYSLVIGLANAKEISGAAEFLAAARYWAEKVSPFVNNSTKVENTPELKKAYDIAGSVLHSFSLGLYVEKALLDKAGYSKNLSEATGWVKGKSAITEEQVKILALVKKLVADKKRYLSSNAVCSIETGVIIDSTVDISSCKGFRSMREEMEDAYESMTEAGYVYDSKKQEWVSK